MIRSYLSLASTLFSHVEGDTVSLLFGANQIDIVSNQKVSGANTASTKVGPEVGGTEIWHHSRINQFLSQPLVLA